MVVGRNTVVVITGLQEVSDVPQRGSWRHGVRKLPCWPEERRGLKALGARWKPGADRR